MPRRLDPATLDSLSAADAFTALVRRFPWMGDHPEFLREALAWQDRLNPRPNFYFRWHLPRLLCTANLLRSGIQPNMEVVDIAAHIPFSVFLQHQFGGQWTRTTFEPGPYVIEESQVQRTIPSVQLDCDSDPWPLPSGHYDIAMLTEVIEHLHRHPQHALSEINRILKPGGLVLLTTPNVTAFKKLLALSEGKWDFDSPTFGNDWGHRYEFSYYQMRECLRLSGFEPVRLESKDIYFDDPQGLRPGFELLWALAGKVLSGQPKIAARLYLRRGSGLFFLARKIGTPETSHLRI